MTFGQDSLEVFVFYRKNSLKRLSFYGIIVFRGWYE